MGWIQTYQGRSFEYQTPENIDQIDIYDIAHALSNICRFGGHCKRFYSVADHSIRCADVAKNMGLSKEIQLWCLLHDAAEAYIGDIPTPLKKEVGIVYNMWDISIITYEDIVLDAIKKKFNLGEMPKEVKEIDEILLWTEVRDLFDNKMKWREHTLRPLEEIISPRHNAEAESLFIWRYRSLTDV